MGRSKKDRQKEQSLPPSQGHPSDLARRGKTVSSGAPRPKDEGRKRRPRRRRKKRKHTLTGWFQSKAPVVRFVVVFGAVLGLFYLVYLPFSQTQAYRSYLALIAEASGLLLWILGYDVTVIGRSIGSVPDFAVSIVPGCDGMEAIALFASAVLASPVAFRSRLWFMVIGVVALLAVNVVRVVTLFLTGLYLPETFETMHWDLWPGVLIVVVLICWLIWARWAVRHRSTQSDVSR